MKIEITEEMIEAGLGVIGLASRSLPVSLQREMVLRILKAALAVAPAAVPSGRCEGAR